MKIKLSSIAEIVSGATPSTSVQEYYDGDVVWLTPKDLSDQGTKYIIRGERNITEEGFRNCSARMIPPYNLLMSSRAPIGLLAINEVECCTNQGFKSMIVDRANANVDYLYYYIKHHLPEVEALGSGTTFKEVSRASLEKWDIELPDLPTQNAIASVLSSLDHKIALNRKANELLESMAKQLYDYWFVQFDFPNAEGKPYKSSGGKMVYNETLKRDIPEGWEVKQLAELLELSENGEWGQEEQDSNTIEVNCIRGADIVDLIGAPTRYLSQNKTSKLMQEDDIIVEISGGSPTQATGRCNYVSKEILELYHDKLTCSNFCKFLRLSDRVYAPYFYYLWALIYKNGNMFHYEGKTSGIKNLQIDNLLAEHWYIPPKHFASSYCKIAADVMSKIGKNKKEILRLTSLRDYLLPLLMNGQVKVS